MRLIEDDLGDVVLQSQCPPGIVTLHRPIVTVCWGRTTAITTSSYQPRTNYAHYVTIIRPAITWQPLYHSMMPIHIHIDHLVEV